MGAEAEQAAEWRYPFCMASGCHIRSDATLCRTRCALAAQQCIRRQSEVLTGSLGEYKKFESVPIMFYDQPAEEDQPATLVDDLRMLTDAGFRDADCYWKKRPLDLGGPQSIPLAHGDDVRETAYACVP